MTLAAAVGVLGLALPALAANVTIGAGSAVNLGSGSLALGCADLDVSGTLTAGTVGFTGARDVAINPSGVVNGNSATLSLSGDWDNAGTFNAGSSTVAMVDGCALASSAVTGNTSFANLSISTTSAKQVSFATGSTQSMSGLLLHGVAGNRLVIRSSLNGSPAFFNLNGTSSVDHIDVADIDAQTGGDIPIGHNSVKGPNTLGWIFGVPVPMLAPLALGGLVLLLLATGQRWLPRRARADRTL
jgi:hypothetical protein